MKAALSFSGYVSLDTNLTPNLLDVGNIAEIVNAITGYRRKLGLEIGQLVHARIYSIPYVLYLIKENYEDSLTDSCKLATLEYGVVLPDEGDRLMVNIYTSNNNFVPIPVWVSLHKEKIKHYYFVL